MRNFKTALLGGLVAFTINAPFIAQTANAQDTSSDKEKCAGADIDTNRLSLDDVQLPDAASCADNTYTAEYFQRYAPRTALDMVSRIPGFQISSSDGKRGLGNGGANVLINGDRISGKTGARDQLSRINARNVVTVKIVDGTSLDIPGLSGQVADITTKNTGVSGTWEWNPEFRNRVKANLLRGKATVSGETGNLGWSFTAENDSFRNGNRGPETLTHADGTLFETRYEDGQYYGDNPGVSADFTWKPEDEHTANLNLKYYQFNFNSRDFSKSEAVTSAGANIETLFSRAEDEYNYTIDTDYEFPFLKPEQNGKLKLIGYYRFEHSPTVSRFDVFDPQLGHTDGSRFFRVADEAELIGRTEYSWKPAEDRDWQFAVEGVFNYLDIVSSLKVLDATGAFVDEALDGATARVEEKRAEATLTHSRQLSPKWDVQASIGAEYSEIAQTTRLPQEFVRPKGFVSATYKPDDSLKITTKVEREVGQLSFFDFISSLDLQNGFDTDGNKDLVPQQSWNGEVEFDKSFGDGNTFKATVYGELISDRVDRIALFDPLDKTKIIGDAVGNIPTTAKRYGIDLAATLKGDKWGFKGTQLDLKLELRNSSIEDPIAGFNRRFNNDKVSFWGVEFRHDIPDTNWAWGFYSDQFIDAPNYRISTINNFNFAGPWGSAFVEHKDVFGLKVKAQVANLYDASDDFRREVYDVGRKTLTRVEDQSREFDTIYRFTVSGTF